MEIWKYIEGYEGKYEVSSQGRVKSLGRYITPPNGGEGYIKERILKGSPNDNGYERVFLSKNGRTKTFYIHRLVASHFIDRGPNKNDVNHMNGNKNDNRASNLEWVDKFENMKHAVRNNLISSKLTTKDVDNILTLRGKVTVKKIAKSYGVNESTVNRIYSGKIWSSHTRIKNGIKLES